MKNTGNNHQKAFDDYDYLSSSSSQDCTGLIPTAPVNDGEIENYEELYPFLPKAVMPKDHK